MPSNFQQVILCVFSVGFNIPSFVTLEQMIRFTNKPAMLDLILLNLKIHSHKILVTTYVNLANSPCCPINPCAGKYVKADQMVLHYYNTGDRIFRLQSDFRLFSNSQDHSGQVYSIQPFYPWVTATSCILHDHLIVTLLTVLFPLGTCKCNTESSTPPSRSLAPAVNIYSIQPFYPWVTATSCILHDHLIVTLLTV